MSEITTDFIKATKKLYSQVGTILTHLHVIEGDVKLIREQSVKNAGEQHSDTQASNSEQQPSPSVSSPNHVLDRDKAKGNKHKSKDQAENGFKRFINRWRRKIQKPVFLLQLATVIGLVFYTCETRKTNTLTQQALQFQRDSIAAEITIGDVDFADYVVANKQIGVYTTLNNIGRSPAFYGIEVYAFHWTALPDAFPLVAPQPDTTLQPTISAHISIYDPTVASDEFIYGIPHMNEVRSNPATRHREPPLPRPTVFFLGRLVYDSLGIRTDQEFCFFMVYRENGVTTLGSELKTDGRFMLLKCPKWNETTKRATQ